MNLNIKLLVLLSVVLTVGSSNVDLNLFSDNLLKNIGEYVLKNDTKIDTPCLLDIKFMMSSMNKVWAIQMLDAAGKIPSGISVGNYNNLGQFDLCIGIQEYERNIKGKYCLATISPTGSGSEYKNIRINGFTQRSALGNLNPFGIGINLAICIPHRCSSHDIEDIINMINPDNNISVPKDLCQTNEPLELSAGDWCAIAMLIVFGSLVLVSTTYDFIASYMENHKPKDILIAFSMKTNTERLFKINNSSGSLKCVHGIRTLSMFWVILGHRYFASLATPVWSLAEIFEWTTKYEAMIILGGTVSVDTFLLLSGLLLTYVFMKTMEKEKSFNVFIFYLHRHLRLTPAFAAIILLQATLYKHMGSGPVYHSILDFSVNDCKDNWWPALLYVQNYVRPEHTCLGQSWYLAVDMQLYYLSPLILYPLYKSFKYGMINLSIWILAFFTTLVTIVYMNDWSAAAVPVFPGSERKTFEYYIVTHMRAVPWLIGIAVGYAIYRTNNKKIRINKFVVAACYIISFIIMITVVFGMKTLQSLSHVPNKLEDGTYDAFHRIAWVLAVAWIIFACIHGYGGPINWILSLSIWEILGRLSYSMYLVHLSIQFWYSASLRVVPNFSNVTEVYTFFGDIIFVTFIAYLVSMMFESPIGVLEKLIFNKKKPQNTVETPVKVKELVE